MKSKSLFSKLANTKEYLIHLFRNPEADVAESIIRLRRLRGLTQSELAKKLNTRQPAVARYESGLCNMKLSTLRELAVALDSTIRIDMQPVEMLSKYSSVARWWEEDATNAGMKSMSYSFEDLRMTLAQNAIVVETTADSLDVNEVKNQSIYQAKKINSYG